MCAPIDDSIDLSARYSPSIEHPEAPSRVLSTPIVRKRPSSHRRAECNGDPCAAHRRKKSSTVSSSCFSFSGSIDLSAPYTQIRAESGRLSKSTIGILQRSVWQLENSPHVPGSHCPVRGPLRSTTQNLRRSWKLSQPICFLDSLLDA